MVSGVYMKSMSSNSEFQHARELSDRFAQLEGRRPRILVAKIGQTGMTAALRLSRPALQISALTWTLVTYFRRHKK
jgi:hypothetical protein